jgi:hypothetical protein
MHLLPNYLRIRRARPQIEMKFCKKEIDYFLIGSECSLALLIFLIDMMFNIDTIIYNNNNNNNNK